MPPKEDGFIPVQGRPSQESWMGTALDPFGRRQGGPGGRPPGLPGLPQLREGSRRSAAPRSSRPGSPSRAPRGVSASMPRPMGAQRGVHLGGREAVLEDLVEEEPGLAGAAHEAGVAVLPLQQRPQAREIGQMAAGDDHGVGRGVERNPSMASSNGATTVRTPAGKAGPGHQLGPVVHHGDPGTPGRGRPPPEPGRRARRRGSAASPPGRRARHRSAWPPRRPAGRCGAP